MTSSVLESIPQLHSFLYYICAPVDKILVNKARHAIPLEQQSFFFIVMVALWQ